MFRRLKQKLGFGTKKKITIKSPDKLSEKSLINSHTSPIQEPNFLTIHNNIGSSESNNFVFKRISPVRRMSATRRQQLPLKSQTMISNKLNEFHSETRNVKSVPSVLAMTYNIGDADISAMNQLTGFKKNSPLDNIFYKMMNLHFVNKISLPNIIIIGLQEVQDNDVSYITDKFETELKSICNWDETNSMINDINDKKYIMEIVQQFNEKQYKFSLFQTANGNSTSSKYVKTCNFNFNILTMVIYSSNVIKANTIPLDNIHKYCPNILSSSGAYKNKIPTKGFVVVKFEYQNSNSLHKLGLESSEGIDWILAQPIYIINMHAPFKNDRASKDFFLDLSQHMTNMGIKQTNNVVILGDYNSRSLIYGNGGEYIKNIPNDTCEPVFTDSIYCQTKTNLEELKNEDRNNYLHSQLQKPYRELNLTDNDINSYHNLRIIKNLTASNSFKTKTKWSLWGGILKEYDIQFLPTYKRVTTKDFKKSIKKCSDSKQPQKCKETVKKTGEFDLSVSSFPIHKMKYLIPDSMKTTVLRLPGYADRIMVAGSGINLFEDNMYTSIPVFGNDHIPVVASFILM